MIRIAIDSGLKATAQDGIGNYFRNLVLALGDITSDLDLVIHPDSFWSKRLSWPPFGLRKLLYLGWNNLVLPRLIRQQDVDILHGINMVVPFASLQSCATAITIYDLTYLRFPQTLPVHFRLYYRWLIPFMVRRADHILAISEFTKSELVTLLNIPENKITVTYLASKISDHSLSHNEALRLLSGLGIERNFILAVGTIEPRKNLVRLVQAFSKIVRQHQVDVDLVIVGTRGWLSTSIVSALSESEAAARIKFLGYVSDETLAALYQMATFFIYPSIYEGFGLPIIEAMSLGTPVITSNCSAMPEVAGESALLIDPFDVESIYAAMIRLIRDHDLRKDLGAKGREQAHSFSWRSTAQHTAAIYRKLVAAYR